MCKLHNNSRLHKKRDPLPKGKQRATQRRFVDVRHSSRCVAGSPQSVSARRQFRPDQSTLLSRSFRNNRHIAQEETLATLADLLLLGLVAGGGSCQAVDRCDTSQCHKSYRVGGRYLLQVIFPSLRLCLLRPFRLQRSCHSDRRGSQLHLLRFAEWLAIVDHRAIPIPFLIHPRIYASGTLAFRLVSTASLKAWRALG